MTMVRETTCCGVQELEGLDEGPQEAVKSLADAIFCQEQTTAHILFTDVPRYRNGSKLCAYIKRNKLGAVVKTYAKRNPNTNNSVIAWLWTPNKKALMAWFLKHGGNREDFCGRYRFGRW